MVLISELEYDPENPIPRRKNEDVVRLYFDTEPAFMAAYADDEAAAAHRERAGFVISSFSVGERFDPYVPYLAMNYFDRCSVLTTNEPHSVKLIAISCLTLASKMRDINFSIPQFLATRPNLDEVMIEEVAWMEFRILRELDWRLRPVLAPCYVPHFAPKFDTAHGIGAETIREIIIYAQYDVWFTKFRPSVIAASALLAACDFLYSDEIVNFFVEIVAEPILKEAATAIEDCMKGIIFRCHDLKLTIESAVSENESQPKLRIRAGLPPQQANAEENAASAQDKGKQKANVEIVEIEDSEEESDEEDLISLRWIRQQRIQEKKIAPIEGQNSNSEQKTLEEAIEEESSNSEQAVIGDENANIEQKTQAVAVPELPFGGFSELDSDSDSSIGPGKFDTVVNKRIRGLQLSKESAERVRFLLLELSGTESETEKDSDQSHGGDELKQSAQIEAIEEEPVPEEDPEPAAGSQGVAVSGEQAPLIDPSGEDSEAAVSEGFRTRRRRSRGNFCKGFACSLL